VELVADAVVTVALVTLLVCVLLAVLLQAKDVDIILSTMGTTLASAGGFCCRQQGGRRSPGQSHARRQCSLEVTDCDGRCQWPMYTACTMA